jgi:hypothetical protein
VPPALPAATAALSSMPTCALHAVPQALANHERGASAMKAPNGRKPL